MNNIKIFENDLPDIDLSKEKTVSLDCEALGLVLGRDPLTLVQIGLESKKNFLIKLNRDTYKAPNLVKFLSIQYTIYYALCSSRFIMAELSFKCKTKNIFCTKLAQK